MIIVAFDPGITTGLATFYHDRFVVEQLDSRDLTVIYNTLNWLQPDVVCYEDFKHRPNLMKAELYSKEVIGVIRLWCQQHDVPIALTPLPARAKAFWTDDKIKRIHLWKPGQIHAMDALRVLLVHREKTDKEWFTAILQELKDG